MNVLIRDTSFHNLMLQADLQHQAIENETVEQQDQLTEIILSRPAYNRGETLTGLIKQNNNHNLSHKKFKGHVVIIGKCRIDHRWHDTTRLIDLYGIHPLLLSNDLVKNYVLNQSNENYHDLCFFSSNIVEFDASGQDDDVDFFLVTCDLPKDLPHSVSLTCCKYYYSILVIISNESKIIISSQSLSFNVTTSFNANDYNMISTTNLNSIPKNLHEYKPKAIIAARLKIGSCHVYPLPKQNYLQEYLKTTQSLNASSHSSLVTEQTFVNQHDVKSLRINNEQNEAICLLYILSSSIMIPGNSTMELLFYPLQGGSTQIKKVNASLHGVELVFFDDAGTTRARKTRTLILDKTYAQLNASKKNQNLVLVLPSHCPCTISTNITEIYVYCHVEIVLVGDKKLSLEFPIEVVHHIIQRDQQEEKVDGDEYDKISLGDEAVSSAFGDIKEEAQEQPNYLENLSAQKDLFMLHLFLSDYSKNFDEF